MTKAIVVLSGIALAIFIIFMQPQQQKSDCNPEELSQEQALEYSKNYLVEEGYDAGEVSQLTIVEMFKNSTEYPRFQFELRGLIAGNETRFSGYGNGCGVEEIFNYGVPL